MGICDEDELGECAMWKVYIVTGHSVAQLRMRDKRDIFHTMRTVDGISHDAYFPQYGFTAGEFSMWQVLKECPR